MKKRKIPFSRPFFSNEDLDDVASKIRKVLRSGWLTSGPLVSQFEEKFAEFMGVDYAGALNSCTASLHSILLALKIGKGDEVIVPSNTFVATANAALYVGAKPVFADSDPETFNVFPKDIENKISNKTKAIIVVHLGGNPCDMDEICEIADENNLKLIEDCAHAHGSKHKGRNCGTFGIAAAFSFYPTKIMTTGEGGIVTTNEQEIVEKVRTIRNHGRTSYGPTEIVELGYNYRMSEINAVLGLSQLERIKKFINQRKKIAEVYNETFSKNRLITSQVVKDGNLSSYYAYIVKLSAYCYMNRDYLRKKLLKKGVETSILYYPIHLQPLYTKLYGYKIGDLPIAEELGRRSLALPIFNDMDVSGAEYVIDTLKEVMEL